jgi:2-succinyl-6-hydroxy-2,4-cyclohexadiene-1-carboxylate synthase
MTHAPHAGPARFVRNGPVELAYEEHGAGERPFVLVHGFTGSRDDWHEMLPVLAARGRTLALDLRGHGDSSNTGDPASYVFERLADDVVAFLDATGVARCDLLGHSMGGVVAQLVALARPERVASLLLMDTTSEPISPNARGFLDAGAKIARESGMQALYEIVRGAAERAPSAPSVARWIERVGADVHWERIRAKMLAMDPIAFATLAPQLAADWPGVTARLGEIACPTTVLVGAEDTPFLRPSEVLASSIPGARLAVLPDAHHSPQLENPEAWLAAVRSHLDWARS